MNEVGTREGDLIEEDSLEDTCMQFAFTRGGDMETGG